MLQDVPLRITMPREKLTVVLLEGRQGQIRQLELVRELQH